LLKCLSKGRFTGFSCSTRIQMEAGINKNKHLDELNVDESLLQDSENIGKYVDHLTELALSVNNIGPIGSVQNGREEEEEEEDIILLQPTDFSAFYSGNQAFRNYLS